MAVVVLKCSGTGYRWTSDMVYLSTYKAVLLLLTLLAIGETQKCNRPQCFHAGFSSVCLAYQFTLTNLNDNVVQDGRITQILYRIFALTRN